MTVLWWLVSTVLVVLSSVLLAAGMQGKEGTIRIGKVRTEEADEQFEAETRPVRTSNVAVGVIGILVGIAAVLLFGI